MGPKDTLISAQKSIYHNNVLFTWNSSTLHDSTMRQLIISNFTQSAYYTT